MSHGVEDDPIWVCAVVSTSLPTAPNRVGCSETVWGTRVKPLSTMLAAAMVLGTALGVGHATAQQAPTLAGKTVSLIIGFGPGSGYDSWGRLVARHIGRHLPGAPQVVPQNMPGAGSFVAINHIYAAAPKDGSVFGIVARDAALGPLSGAPGARFDATKLTWIGTPTRETNVCIAYHTSKVKKVEDLLSTQLILGDTGPGTGTYSYPKALSGLLGFKFKSITGFAASNDVYLAIDRGEVEGICESLDSALGKRPDWVKDKKITILFQGGAVPSPELKGVPLVIDFAKTEEQRQAIRYLYAGQGFGRPFAAPSDMAPERVKMLRDAFDAAMKDPELAADVRKSNLTLDPVPGADLTTLVQQIYATPKPIVEKVGALIK